MKNQLNKQPRRHTAWPGRVPRQYIDFMHLRWPTWLSNIRKYVPTLACQCLACHAWPSIEVLCPACWQRFYTGRLRCTGCALALPGLSPERPRCGSCLRHPPPWQHAHAWVDYRYPWNHLITRWKFGQQPALAPHFARWMMQDPAVQALVSTADVLLPVPLSLERMRERGYNPAAQLVQHLHGSQHALHALQRVRHTPAQSGLTRAQRLRNLRQAFAVPAAQQHHIAGQRVLLVDDVMTTGATLTMASHCVLQAGATQVQVLCMARTP